MKNGQLINRAEIIEEPIIGYDKAFWLQCDEENREMIMSLKKSNHSVQFKMHCDRQHNFLTTAYRYFVRGRTCPYCKCENEIGAVTIDPAVQAFWDDSRFDLQDISETSEEVYHFRCPFCNERFDARMIDVVNRSPKCVKCNDGNEQLYNIPESEMIFGWHVRKEW